MQVTNVLHVVPGMYDCSITRIVEMLITNIDDEQFNWFVASATEDVYSEKYASLGTNVTHFGIDEQGNPIRRWRAAQNLRAYIKANNIDIVHAHTPSTMFLTWLATRGTPVKKIYTKHLLTYPQDRDMGWLFTAADRLSLYGAHHVIPVSQTMAKIIQGFPFLVESKVTAIQNAIDLEYFYAHENRAVTRAEFGVSDDQVFFGYTGRLVKMKRIEWLLECFAEVIKTHPNVRLVIVGKGPLKEELIAYGDTLNINDNVIWAGWRTDIPNILAAVDVYLQPSANEGLSLSILEAMAAGKPVIATEVGGINEVIQSDKTGIIVLPEAKDKFTAAMTNIVGDDAKRQSIAKAGKAFVWEYFNMQRMTKSYQSIYDQYPPDNKDLTYQ